MEHIDPCPILKKHSPIRVGRRVFIQFIYLFIQRYILEIVEPHLLPYFCIFQMAVFHQDHSPFNYYSCFQHINVQQICCHTQQYHRIYLRTSSLIELSWNDVTCINKKLSTLIDQCQDKLMSSWTI